MNTQPPSNHTKSWNEGAVITIPNSGTKTTNEVTRFKGAS
jgi:hypothetical protein